MPDSSSNPNIDPNAQPEPSVSDLIADRKRKRDRLRDELNVDPYGGRVDGLISLHSARELYDGLADEAHKADSETDQRPRVRVAGRIMQHRVMGNLIFMQLRDATGDLQIAVSKKAVNPDAFKQAKIADLSDWAVAYGALGTTKTGEVTVWAEGEQGYQIASKSITPPPGKWHGLTDAEQRYRKRYVDLYANPQVMQTMQLRIRIIDEIRQYLRDHGYMEVETPMLQPIHGGAAARPFQTHHNALDLPLYLRIAPELYLKRLLVGGMPKVFEINRNFRNEGISPRHNPEFTMLEAYEAFGNWETMANMVEDMVCTVAQNVFGTLEIHHRDTEGTEIRTINLQRPWRRVSMVDLVEEKTGWKFDKQPLQEANPDVFNSLVHKNIDDWVSAIRNEWIVQGRESEFDEAKVRKNFTQSEGRKSFDQHHFAQLSPAEQLVEVYEKLVEPTLIDPCFVTRVPGVIIPLAKRCKDDDYFADVYELAINGVEISPGYSELNDPDIQEAQFSKQVGDREEQQQIDEDFLEALRVGMPPAGGMGLGIDRLVMMLTGAQSIRDVILFPLMRPKSGHKGTAK